MKGGRILGEGVDGCVFSEPLWPCAAGSKVTGQIPSGSDKSVVAKIVKKDDVESILKIVSHMNQLEIAKINDGYKITRLPRKQ
jgi:hypothetical protein